MSEPLNRPVTRVVRDLFGTVATLAVVGTPVATGVDAAFARLDEIERRLSPYREDSEISRIRDGSLERAAAHAETRFVLDQCLALREESGGLFDERVAGPDGRLDPSGFVKGWAIGVAAALLVEAGMTNAALGIGGDVHAWGDGPGGVGWIVGVADPSDRSRAVTRVALRNEAIATSGDLERPGHLRDPRTGTPVQSPWLSFSVIGPSIARADALATIGYIEGAAGLVRIGAEPGYGALGLARDGSDRITDGFAARVV